MDIELISLESKLTQLIYKDNQNTVHFDYGTARGDISVDIITYNVQKSQAFLLHSNIGTTKTEAIQSAIKYFEETMLEENTYTVVWQKKDSNEQLTSYFRAKNMAEVMKKFYHNSGDEVVIFEVKLNPVA